MSKLRNLLTAVVVISLTSCTTMENASAPAVPAPAAQEQPAAPEPVVDASADLSTSVSALADAREQAEQVAEPVIYRGNDQQVRMPTTYRVQVQTPKLPPDPGQRQRSGRQTQRRSARSQGGTR